MAGGTQAQLHPLILLSITDTISRDVMRGHTYPFVGGIVGQVTREGISLEHTFDINLKLRPGRSGWELNQEFFSTRLWQTQEVHKTPVPLDFVGFWTIGKADQGPGPELKHILPELFKVNENALVLVFHADVLVQGKADETRMPFTIYEPVYGEKQRERKGVDGVMLPQSFRAVEWEMATGEAEMISLEFVKNGSGNATRVRTGDTGGSAAAGPAAPATPAKDKSTKNGSKEDEKKAATTAKAQEKTLRAAATDLYTPEEEEMLSFLTTRANAIRTLLNRLSSIKSYLDSAEKNPDGASFEILRAVKAMLARLPGIEAAKNAGFVSDPSETTGSTGATADSGMTDAMLVELLGSIGQSLQTTRELGGKFSAVDSSRRDGRQGPRGGFGDVGSPGVYSDAMDLT